LGLWLVEQRYADPASLEKIWNEVRKEMEAAVKFAIDAPYPYVSEVDEDVYA
jgi:acetoin:2,6-dichlorophenolindophenol oxidoreductase subunit alpha